MTTQNEKIVNFLSDGENHTVREITSRLKVGNLSARISELREQGFTIYTNQKRLRGGRDRGKVVTAYRLDTSSLGV